MFCSDVLYHDVPSCDVSYRNAAMFPKLLACEQACKHDKTAGNIVKKLAYKSSGIKIKLDNTPKRHLAAFYCNIRIRRPKRKLGTSTKTKYASSSRLMMEQPRQSCHIAPKETTRKNTLKSSFRIFQETTHQSSPANCKSSLSCTPTQCCAYRTR